MSGANLLEKLRSHSISERVAATYELDERTIGSNPEIVAALRENLRASSNELLEVTVMRLGLRAKDCSSFELISEIFCSAEDELVLSACAFALTALAKCGEAFRTRSLELLLSKLPLTSDLALKKIYETEIKRLGS